MMRGGGDIQHDGNGAHARGIAPCTAMRHRDSRDAQPAPTYVYDGTLEGYLTCVFTAFERKETPFAIETSDCMQIPLFGQVECIETETEKALRVAEGLRRKLGPDELERIKLAFLSDDQEREMKLLRYIQIAMRKGRYAYCDHSHPVVAEYEKLWRRVSNERHNILQFARFSQLEDGVYFSRINPSANVVPAVMQHFSKRFNTESFVIYDEVHGMAGISRGGDWRLVRTDSLTIPDSAADDALYEKMWRSFYDSICNEQRYNPALRRSFMPMRLWRNICEVADALEPLDRNDDAVRIV